MVIEQKFLGRKDDNKKCIYCKGYIFKNKSRSDKSKVLDYYYCPKCKKGMMDFKGGGLK